MGTLLHNRGFVLLRIGQLLLTVAIWSLRIVLLIRVNGIAHSGTSVSLVGLAGVVPLLVLVPFGGALIDGRSLVVVVTAGAGEAQSPKKSHAWLYLEHGC